MADLAAESHGGVAESDLTESLTRSLRSFFDQTSSGDSEYLTRTATEFVSQIRDAEVQRIRRAEPDVRAAMVLIKHPKYGMRKFREFAGPSLMFGQLWS